MWIYFVPSRLSEPLRRGAAQAERGELLDGKTEFAQLQQLIAERYRRPKKKANCE